MTKVNPDYQQTTALQLAMTFVRCNVGPSEQLTGVGRVVQNQDGLFDRINFRHIIVESKLDCCAKTHVL